MKTRLAAILLVLLAGACANASVTSSNGARTGRLVVSQNSAKGFIEGYVAFIDVARDGHSVFSDRLAFDQPLSHEFDEGSYQLTFTVRPCDGSCGRLDPPTETCSIPFTINAGETVKAYAIERPTKGCSIELRS
jgi:hypothetical protein